MICSNCATENKAGRRFCVSCGTPLAAACPSCGAGCEPTDAFCGSCGTPLTGPAAGRSSPVEALGPAARAGSAIGSALGASGGPGPAFGGALAERRLVSVLFADLVGFTPFAEERDAEDVRDTLTRYFEIATDVIGRYGGTIEKFIGDAVMAVWGAPTAREDDAERSVRAALDLVDAVRVLGATIQARAGVLTGEAAVTIGATNQGMVAGDLVNTAARLQSVAQPGTVLVGETTMRAASAAIAFEAAGEQALKGKAAPVPAHRALRVVAQRGGSGRSDLPEPPFVGRDEELRLLKDLIATTGRDRRTRLVSITGPGGIGKSRLAWELEKFIDGISETIYWHRGRSPAYGEGITFWALGEMVRRRAGLAETDDEPATRERIRATVAEYVPGEDDRRWVEPALLTLLGLEPAPAGGRDVLFAAWRIFFERIAERSTTVLLFEDLQWADSGLLDFIEHLLEWCRNVPLIVVTLARPELFDRRPDWGAETRNLTRLALEPLTDDAMGLLLAGFVPGLPDDAVRAILDRADGIPLYAVETVRALVADGRLVREGDAYRPVGVLGELAVPDTLRSLIASRLDSLDPADRSLVADASVLGQSFSLSGLTAVSGLPADALEPRLKGLLRREIFDVEVDPRSPERGLYRFVQSLIREVAYGTLAKRERRTRHLAAARYFEALGDDELAGLLASHYVAAHEASAEGAEADAVAIQARLALSGAAERAATLGAHEQAMSYLRQAIAITADPVERTDLHLRAAASANAAALHGEARTLVGSAIDLARSSGDGQALGAAQALLGEVLIDDADPPAAATTLEEAVAAFPHDGGGEVRATLLANLSRAYMRTGQSTRSVAAADQALDLAEHLGLERIVAETLNNKGSSLAYLGRRREALALLQAAVDLAHEGGYVAAEIRALNNLAGSVDDARRARDCYRVAEALAMRVGNRNLARWATESARFANFMVAEDWDAAVGPPDELGEDQGSLLDEARRLTVSSMFLSARGESIDPIIARLEELEPQISDRYGHSAVRIVRADRALHAGAFDQAADDALAASELDDSLRSYGLAFALRSMLWARDLERARAIAGRLYADPGTGGDVELDRAAARAGIAALEGRTEEAVAGYRSVIARFRALGSDMPAALYALDLVKLVGPDQPGVREVAAEARTIFERVRARRFLDHLDVALSATGGDGADLRAPLARDARAPSRTAG